MTPYEEKKLAKSILRNVVTEVERQIEKEMDYHNRKHAANYDFDKSNELFDEKEMKFDKAIERLKKTLINIALDRKGMDK